MTLICVRATVVLGYLVALLLPMTSHIRLSATLLGDGGGTQALWQPLVLFVVSVAALTGVLLLLVVHQLRGLRQRAAGVAA